MNRTLGVLTFIAFVPMLPADEKPGAPSALRGKWEVTAATFNGTAFMGLKGRLLDFGEDEVATHDGEVPTRATGYTVDATTDPRRIDLDSGYEGKKALGIYAIDKDELRVCYAEPGAGRPAKFESKPGDRHFLLVLRRVKE